ncbi:5606_t:CDS:2, partial [Rhizophagus irregularis]
DKFLKQGSKLLGFEENNIRVVVGLDFGTTYSGFAYCHVSDEVNICSNDIWNGNVGQLKTNTVLQYDDEYDNVKLWGAPALVKKQGRSRTRRQKNSENDKPVELFKLHLGDLLEELKPKLPVEYKKAITDYLREIGKVIKEIIDTRWPNIDYFENVLLIITVPAEFSDKAKAIMRICAFDAGLIKEKYSTNLQFTTERKNLYRQNLAQPGTNFMIVDCGGGTVDLTTRKLVSHNQLGEITERSGDFCGSTFVDVEFIKYLRKILGDEPMDLLRDNNYGQMQYLIQQFCNDGKIPFTGDDPDFLYELDIRETVPILEQQYVIDDDIRKTLDNDEWIIEIDFEIMESIFKPVIQKILQLIKTQLDNAHETCSAMFLVGGFSESKYLQKKIKQKFSSQVNFISVPTQPTAAISRGAAIYGLSIKLNDLNNVGNDDNMKCVISSRVLKYTYGIKVIPKWKEGDPIHRKVYGDRIEKFDCLATRGTKMDINQEITSTRTPIFSEQKDMLFGLYYTEEYDGTYCDDPGMKLLGNFIVDLPGSGIGRSVLLGITFGKMEIIATAKNKQSGQSYKTTFKFNFDG